jgi:periplasmic divalent cation tolerance protein
MTNFIQVLTTTDKQADAKKIAQELVELRLAACVQIVGPITSVYRWQGKMETAVEWQCLIKTRRDLYKNVEEAVRRLHSYQTPEIVAFDISVGSDNYLKWIDAETTDPNGP